MRFRLEVVCISDSGQEQRSQVLTMERHQLAMETLGLNLCEGKAMLEGVQDFMVSRLLIHRACHIDQQPQPFAVPHSPSILLGRQ